MSTHSPQLLCPIIPLCNPGAPAVPNRMQEEVAPDESTGSAVATGEKKSSWKSITHATAKLLRGVRDPADAFGPLKSLAGGLYLNLED